MDLNEYQRKAQTTAKYPPGMGILYNAMQLASEGGEVNGKLAKAIRNETLVVEYGRVILPFELRAVVLKEVGDILWSVAGICTDFDVSLEDVAQQNLDKLADRSIRGVILGEGDDR